MRRLIIMLTVLSAGCSTQLNLKSVLPAHAVAPCIASKWESCGASGSEPPVSVEKETGGYLVGIERTVWYGIPSLADHSSYTVWAEVLDANPGSATEYHRAFQISHGCLDRAVVECQGKTQ